MEVVVALAVLGTAGLMLFAWINQNLQTAVRLRDAQARAQLQLEGVTWLGLVNPCLEPVGERQRGDMRLKWSAQPIEPLRSEFDFAGGLVPRWQLGLFRVEAQLSQTTSKLSVTWTQAVAGWRPVSHGASQAAAGFGLKP